MTDTLIDTHDLDHGYRIEIHWDPDPFDPRKEYDNVGTMWFQTQRNYTLGDEQGSEYPAEHLFSLFESVIGQRIASWPFRLSNDENVEDVESASSDEIAYRITDANSGVLINTLREHYVLLALHVYEHSGITVSSSRDITLDGRRGRADGLIYCTLAKAREEWGDDLEAAYKYLEGEVETYDHYLTGQVYGYVVYGPPDYDEDGEEIKGTREELESCWGFNGDDDYCLEQARDVADSYLRDLPIPRERSLTIIPPFMATPETFHAQRLGAA